MSDAGLDKAQGPASNATSSSLSATARRWTKWASTFLKREKPLGSEPWFNPEADTKQKREWLEQQKAQAGSATSWPEHMYENFYVLGLLPDMEVTQVAEHLCELERKQRHHESDAESDYSRDRDYIQPPQPSLSPQVLFSFPPNSSAPISKEEVAALAFPSGVAPEKLKRTPSLSGLDELIMGRDSDAQQQCFVFMLKVGGNFPLYGCCWYVREMLHRPPYVARQRYRSCKAPFRQCLIAAPRCYCLLTHYPFFELHFRVLKIILDLERLERLLEYDTEKSQLPSTSLAPAATHPAQSSTTGRSSSSADAPLFGAGARGPGTQSHQGDAVGRPGAPASHSSGALAAAVHIHIPVLHNRQRYCSECAVIIEDICPFTPGMSPEHGAPLQQHHNHHHHHQQQLQQPSTTQTNLQEQHRLEQQNLAGKEQTQQVEQQPGQHQLCGQTGKFQMVQPDSEQCLPHQQHQQPEQEQLSQQPQHHQQRHLQEQLCDAQVADRGWCEVCGRPLGIPSNDAEATHSHMQNGLGHPSASNAAAAAEKVQSGRSRDTSEGAAHVGTAAIGPLETGVFHHHLEQVQRQQQQQQAGATSFAAAKNWVASTSMDGTPVVGTTQQQGFDAAAASSAVFDNAAMLAAGGSSGSRAGSAGVAGEDRWSNWQNVVATIRGAASAPMLAPAEDAGGPSAEGVSLSSSQPAPLQQESSLVQRMWDAWAPRTSATPTDTPRVSGLANFLRRASRTSTSQVPSHSEQHSLRPSVQLQHGHMLQGHETPAVGQSLAANVSQQGHQEQVKGSHSSYTMIDTADSAASPSHAVAVGFADVVPAALEMQGKTLATSVAYPGCADELCLRPYSSFKAINSSATSIHSSLPAETAERDGPGSLYDSQPKEAAVVEEPTQGAECRAAIDGEGPPVATAAAATDSIQQCGADLSVAGAGTALPAVRAVHRPTPSVVSNASSFYSAAEQLEQEGAAEGAGTNSMPQSDVALQTAQEDGDHQPPQQDSTSHDHQQLGAHLTQPAIQANRQSSAGQPSSDTERLVSAFAAIAAAATPFAASTNTPVNGPSRTNTDTRHPAPAQQTAAAAAVDKQTQTSSSDSVQLQGSVKVVCSSGFDLQEVAHAGNGSRRPRLAVQAEPAQDHCSVRVSDGIPSSSGLGQHAVDEQQESVVQGQPVRGGPSGKRSQLFEEVALRRSGDMSAELCKTISHLVQVDSVSLLSAYRSSPVPLPGDTYRLMLGDMYRLEFERVLPQPQYAPPGKSRLQHEVLSYAEVECAQQLQLWTVAALCRSLSLENIITVLNAALLEKQIVVFCPHIGTLAAVVLSLVALLRPFSWQSLMLPVTPTSMLAFLEAPVPFVLGVQYKTPSVMNRCHGLMRVNVYKNAIKSASFPALPNSRQLLHALAPHYGKLCDAAPLAVERPVHVITPDEEAAANDFLTVLHEYMSQLCGDLRLHTVVNVGMTKRTGVFMKDSLIESVQAKDRQFMKAFAETQMFAVYADGVISDYCES